MSNESGLAASVEQVQQRLHDLKIVLDPKVVYRLDQVFPRLTGWGAEREMKRRGKLIQLVESTLKLILRDGEEVLYVAKGTPKSWAENRFLGHLATLMNQTVFVMTNVRLVMMKSNAQGQPAGMFWMIYYSEIVDLKSTWTGRLKLKLKDKNGFKFKGFSSPDRGSMRRIVQSALENYRRLSFTPTASQSRENLCCRCFNVLSKGVFVCNQCGAEYWPPNQLALRSLIFPSWGELCMQHYYSALMELIIYLCSWAEAINVLMRDPKKGLALIAVSLPTEHAFIAMITYAVASAGLHLRNSNSDQIVSHDESLIPESVDDRYFTSKP